ncbi:outer membrane protein assembly factor BamE [Rubellimicrobium sp. CFH 75288]|uniref:outer membrane protein assembly factor BamE n=1 Tax=Rubellimicrobium sp. CFH 75288 TaxID=2697034 RepID=UPI0014121A2E|nr:outer membrane protein assembly factor BamE [Rubellimicrobium sp. CFH 75288]NAZ37040.1 outer membrane protein assembly factor BamE [Rubellimicrobium sp. CFH 75288]
MKVVWLAVALGAALALSGCQPLYRNHGFAPSETDLATLAIGQDTRETVVAKLGRPTIEPLLDQRTFYYVGRRVRYFGPLPPEEVRREVLALSFAPNGTLGAVERFGLERGRVIPLSRRVTPGVFADQTFLRQLLGNVGRLDAGTLFGDGE